MVLASLASCECGLPVKRSILARRYRSISVRYTRSRQVRSSLVGIQLIIMSLHRLKLEDYQIGPNAAGVVRHAHGSVLVVR